MVGLISTLRRKGVLDQQDIDQLFDAGLMTFEQSEQTEARAEARLTLEILQGSLAG